MEDYNILFVNDKIIVIKLFIKNNMYLYARLLMSDTTMM